MNNSNFSAIYVSMNYLNARHGDWHMKILTTTNCLHHCYTMRALHILCGVLASCDKNSCYNVASMCIEPSHGTCHSRSNQVLDHIQLNKWGDICLENLLDNLSFYDSLSYHWFTTTLCQIQCRWFCVCAVISCKFWV
jgi:hypothetical protein